MTNKTNPEGVKLAIERAQASLDRGRHVESLSVEVKCDDLSTILAALSAPLGAEDGGSVTAAALLAHMKACHDNISWVATVRDVEQALSEMGSFRSSTSTPGGGLEQSSEDGEASKGAGA